MAAYQSYVQTSSGTLSRLIKKKKTGKNVETNVTENDPENECHMDTHLDVSNFFQIVDEEIYIFTKGENEM